MKTIDAAAISLALLGGAPAFAESSVISPNGSRPNISGAPQNFIGAVVVQPLSGANDHIPASAGHVTFAPGARSAWHTHPAGQVLIVTDGVGYFAVGIGQGTLHRRNRGVGHKGGLYQVECRKWKVESKLEVESVSTCHLL